MKTIIETKIGNIFVEYKNRKNQILFLSGYGDFNTGDNFRKVINSINKKFGYIAIDYPCSGKSEIKDQKYFNKDDYIDSILYILSLIKFENIVICAHSIAGVISVEIANKLLDKCRGVILIEPTTQNILFGELSKNPYLEMIELEKNISNNYSSLIDYFKSLTSKNFTKDLDNKLWENSLICARNKAKKNNEKYLFNIPELVVEGGKLHVSDSYPVIIFSQKFREDEYRESEFFNNHEDTRLLLGGDSHYLHWERAEDISNYINKILFKYL